MCARAGALRDSAQQSCEEILWPVFHLCMLCVELEQGDAVTQERVFHLGYRSYVALADWSCVQTMNR